MSRMQALGFGLVALATVVGLATAGQIVPSLAALGVALVAAFIVTVRQTRQRVVSDPLQGLSLENQSRLRPFIRVRDEIREVVERNPTHPALSVVGLEAVSEANELVDRLTVALRARSEAGRFGVSATKPSLEAFDQQVGASLEALKGIRDDLAMHLAKNLVEDDSLRTRLGQIQSLRTSLAESQDLFGNQP